MTANSGLARRKADRLASLIPQLDSLIGASPMPIDELLDDRPPAAEVPGVYLISLPAERDHAVYVGRTNRKSILGRVRDHVRLNTGSDLRGMLQRHSDFPAECRRYEVRWLRIDDRRTRSAVELFSIAVLLPPFNRI